MPRVCKVATKTDFGNRLEMASLLKVATLKQPIKSNLWLVDEVGWLLSRWMVVAH